MCWEKGTKLFLFIIGIFLGSLENIWLDWVSCEHESVLGDNDNNPHIFFTDQLYKVADIFRKVGNLLNNYNCKNATCNGFYKLLPYKHEA